MALASFSPAVARAQENTRWIPLTGDDDTVQFAGAVNGHPVTLMLDSGAGNLVLDEAFAERIGLAAQEKTLEAQGFVGSQTVRTTGPLVVTFGGITVRVTGAVLADLSAIALTGNPVPVIVGSNLLDTMVVEVDGVARRLGVHRPGTFDPGQARPVEVRPGTGGVRRVQVSIEGRDPVWADFDLGSSTGLSLDGDYARSIGLRDGRKASTWISAQITGVITHGVTMARRVTIGGASLGEVEVNIHDDWNKAQGAVANVGFPLVHRLGRVVIDYPSNALYIYPHATPPKPFDKDRLGLAMAPLDDGGWRVLHVAAGSPAAVAGWKADELIALMDGRATESLEERRARPSVAGRTVKFKMADGSERSLVTADYY